MCLNIYNVSYIYVYNYVHHTHFINVHHTHFINVYHTHFINVHHTHFINVHHTDFINVLISNLLIILGLCQFVLINLLSINKCGHRNVLSKRQVWMSIFHIINFKKKIMYTGVLDFF